MRTVKILILLACLALVLVGCRSNPVYNFTDMSFTTTTGNYSTNDVRNAILQAGTAQGWQMQAVRPGLISGTLNIRDHMAQVDIPYDRGSYSILYRDSDNLRYDGTNIHSNYNGWVQNLRNAIDTRLSLL